MERRRTTRAALGVIGVLAIGLVAPPGVLAQEGGAPAGSITMWVNSADAQPLKDLWARFTEETGITIDVVSFPSDGFETALMQRWATGDRPDVLEWHGNYNWLVAINPRETLRDVSGEAFVGRQAEGITAGLDGVTYGVVLNTPTAWGLFYDKPIFERLGLEPPTTADEVMAACLAIKEADPNIVPLQEAAGSKWTPLVMQGQFQADGLQAGFLQKLIDRQAKVNDADSPWLRSLEFYLKLRDAGCFNSDILTAEFENSPTLLLDDQVAMVSMHSGFIPQALDASDAATVDEKVGFVEWSETRPVVTVEYSPNGTYYLPKTGAADREAAATMFLDFVTGPAYADYVKAAGMIPTMRDVPVPADLPAPMVQIKEAIEQQGTTSPVWSVLPGITDLVNYPSQLINGDLTPQAAVDLLQKQAEQGAKAAGLPAWPD